VRVGADVARRGQRKAAGAQAHHVPMVASPLRADSAPPDPSGSVARRARM